MLLYIHTRSLLLCSTALVASGSIGCGFADATETTALAYSESAGAGSGGSSVTGTSGDTSGSTETQTSTISGGTSVSDSSSTGSTGSTTTAEPMTCGDGAPDPDEGCDDGNNENGDGCSDKCQLEYRFVFMTSQAFTGDLKGSLLYGMPSGNFEDPLELADAHCQKLAGKSKIASVSEKKFKAWLSVNGDVEQSAVDRLGLEDFSGGFISTADEPKLVAASWSDLSTGNFNSRISYTENGTWNSWPLTRVWTATSNDGIASGSDCEGWESGKFSDYGSYGSPRKEKGGWTFASDQKRRCSFHARLYCFEVSQ